MAPNDPSFIPIVMALCVTMFQGFVSTLFQGWSVWPKEYGRSDGIWLSRLGHQRHCSFCLALGLLTPEKASCHIVGCSSSSLVRSMWWRMEALFQQPSKTWDPANNYLSEPSWKQTLHPQASLQNTAIPDNILPVTSQETLIQNHPDNLFPHSWISEAVQDNKCLLFYATSFRVSRFPAIDNKCSVTCPLPTQPSPTSASRQIRKKENIVTGDDELHFGHLSNIKKEIIGGEQLEIWARCLCREETRARGPMSCQDMEVNEDLLWRERTKKCLCGSNYPSINTGRVSQC